MSENFSHKIKAPEIVVLTFNRERGDRQTQIHAIGCRHADKADHIGQSQDSASLVEQTETIYRDDWYYVAPCAR